MVINYFFLLTVPGVRDGKYLFSVELSFNTPNIESEFDVKRIWFVLSELSGWVECSGLPTLKPGTTTIDINSKCLVPRKWSSLMLQKRRKGQWKNKIQLENNSLKSRFPYIGSSCDLLSVLTQFVMAAVWFHTLSTNFAFNYAFKLCFWVVFSSGSTSHLSQLPIWVTWGRGHLLIWVIFPSGSHCVGHIASNCAWHLFHSEFHTYLQNMAFCQLSLYENCT